MPGNPTAAATASRKSDFLLPFQRRQEKHNPEAGFGVRAHASKSQWPQKETFPERAACGCSHLTQALGSQPPPGREKQSYSELGNNFLGLLLEFPEAPEALVIILSIIK